MRTTKTIEPAVVKFWRIKAVIQSIIVVIVVFIILNVIEFFTDASIPEWITIPIYALTVLDCLYDITLAPSLKQKFWQYGFSDDRILLKKGIWFRKQITIPILRIQNVETKIGPIAKTMNLASLEITTAATDYTFPEMNIEEAEQLQKQIQKQIEQTV